MINHDEYLEYQRRYREAHREELRAKDRERNRNNKEWHREYYEKNKERIREAHKKYHKEHYVSQKKDCSNNLPCSEDLFEVWKEINENYLVSNYGKVWSKKRNRLIGCKNTMGYMIALIDGKQKYIHRLVAEAFVPNPDNLPEIDHIDTSPSNNIWTNLRWTDRKGNQNNPITKDKMKESNKGKADKAHKATKEKRSWVKGQKMCAEANRKRVFQYTVDGVFVKEFCSITEAGKEVGCCRESIRDCCRGRYKTIKGFVWKYAETA